MQTFAIMLPILTGQSEQAAGVVSGAFALNGVLAVAGLYLAFALFPARGAAGAGTAARGGRTTRWSGRARPRWRRW